MSDYVFGYASLVAVPGPEAMPGQLRGFHRFWGAAMNNWEGVKHFLDRETGDRPRIRVAYLDIERREGAVVNGIAIPVDGERLRSFDTREINYERVEVTSCFEPAISGRVFTYVGLDAARRRCREGAAEKNVFVSRDYAAGIRLAFERLGDDALAEFERTTEPLPFPERDLQVVLPPSATGS